MGLRPAGFDDLRLLHAWQNDAEIARWMDYRLPLDHQEISQDVERAQREGYVFIVEVDGVPIGKCGLNGFGRDDGVCSLYVYIGDKELWGLGFGRDAVMTLCGYAFETLGMRRVELSMLKGNVRARSAYEACGFVVDRRRCARDSRGRETVIMVLDRRIP